MSSASFSVWAENINVKEVVDKDALIVEGLKNMPAYQLCLNLDVNFVGTNPRATFVHAGALVMQKVPSTWRVCMLELNSDILDSSKKVTIMSVAAVNAPKTSETEASWTEVIDDLVKIMEDRATLLAHRPISKDPARAAASPLPPEVQDAMGAPPVVVWMAPVWPKEQSVQSAGGQRGQEARAVRRRHGSWPEQTQLSGTGRQDGPAAVGPPAAGRRASPPGDGVDSAFAGGGPGAGQLKF